MGELHRHMVCVLENVPFGDMLAEYLDDNLLVPGKDVGIISPSIISKILRVNLRESIDEQIQATFLSHLAEFDLGGLTIAVLHLNSNNCLQHAEMMCQQGVKLIARIPFDQRLRRDVSVTKLNSFVKSRKIPNTNYDETRFTQYPAWVANNIKTLLSA